MTTGTAHLKEIPMTATGFDLLTAAHPHHAIRLFGVQNDTLPGAVVTMKKATGSFFTGIESGDRVVITSTSGSPSVARIDNSGARLVTRPEEFERVDVRTLTEEEAKAAQRAASQAALDAMERAVCSANGLLGAPAGDGNALAALRLAKEYRDNAFAYGVLATYIAEARREEANARFRAEAREILAR